MGYGVSGEALAGQVAAALAHDALARLGALAGCPTLVVGAELDRLIPVARARSLAAAIPGARYVELEGAPHALQWERADALNELLAAFFAEHDPPR